jgi:excisionase family DNA binding protein
MAVLKNSPACKAEPKAMTPTPHPHLLTLAEVAALLRVSKGHVSKLINRQVRGATPLAAVRLGRRVLVRREVLMDWLSRQDQGSVVH